MLEKLVKNKIREIPDWPKKGVNFKDITPLLEDAWLFNKIIGELAKPYLKKKPDKVIGIDARELYFGGKADETRFYEVGSYFGGGFGLQIKEGIGHCQKKRKTAVQNRF